MKNEDCLLRREEEGLDINRLSVKEEGGGGWILIDKVC